MHFYEASIITTKDGMHCQVYSNEHPLNAILVKPKYIPTDKIESDAFQYRFISGRRMNRLNLWADKEKLKAYIGSFKKAYPEYIFKSSIHSEDRLIFSIPIDKIERIYFPKKGFSELMKIPKSHLDNHLKLISEFGDFILKSGLSIKDIGITYSALMGHHLSDLSDINIVIYGKENFWKLMEYLKNSHHPLLRWKTKEDWLEFRKKRNRSNISDEGDFLKAMSRRNSEGFFGNTLFVIFGVENENETWFKWGKEKYVSKGLVKVKGIVTDNFSSIVRPGFYGIKDSEIIDASGEKKEIEKIVFYSRDYCMLAKQGERIESCGVLEEVFPDNEKSYYRVVVGYFDAYISDRREKEYIKLI